MRRCVAQNHQHRAVRINTLRGAEVPDGLCRDQVGQVVLVTHKNTNMAFIYGCEIDKKIKTLPSVPYDSKQVGKIIFEFSLNKIINSW